jgi:hypothetical protein
MFGFNAPSIVGRYDPRPAAPYGNVLGPMRASLQRATSSSGGGETTAAQSCRWTWETFGQGAGTAMKDIAAEAAGCRSRCGEQALMIQADSLTPPARPNDQNSAL